MQRQKVVIPIKLDNDAIGNLTIVSFYPIKCSQNQFNNKVGEFYNIDVSNKIDNETSIQYCDFGNGSCIMLLEETKYQISFEPQIKFDNLEIIPYVRKTYSDVYEPLNISSDIQNEGNINFKSFAGKSFFDVMIDGKRSDKIPFEVRSKKINYHEQYIEMIAYLSKAMSGILFNPRSPLYQYFDPNNKPSTNYEDFMFLEYLFLDENLPYAYEYIRKNIFVNLKEHSESVPTSYASNIGYSGMVNMVCNPENLIKTKDLPSKWPSNMQNYVPNRITQSFYEESVDTPENRLLKYFLEAIDSLIEKLLSEFKQNNYFMDRLLIFENIISDYLSDRWLKDINKLEIVPMNSQILQKKEGYRDIFKFYLNFEFGFRPQWKEMEDIFKGYERRLSELYEFWCYFKLLKVMEKLSNTKIYYEDIFTLNKWKIGLKSGFESKKEFKLDINGNIAEVEFFYNLTFCKNCRYKSYSLNLRPDYTLCIKYNDKEYFIHFDAKYKSKGIPNECDFNKRDHMYKFEDVYKMHTYKDAIENSLGSYVIYPGDFPKIFEETLGSNIPSVGAFNLTPGRDNLKETEKIEEFITEILDYICKESNGKD